MVEAGVHTVFERKLDAARKRIEKTRQIVESDEPSRSHLRRIRGLVRAHQKIYAPGLLKRQRDFPGVHLREGVTGGGISGHALWKRRNGSAEVSDGIRKFVGAPFAGVPAERIRERADVGQRDVKTARNIPAPYRFLAAPSFAADARFGKVPVPEVPSVYELRKPLEKTFRARSAERETERLTENRLGVIGSAHHHFTDKLHALERAAVIAHHRNLAFKSELERYHPHDAHHETVERSYQRKMLPGDDEAQLRGEIGPLKLSAHTRAFFGGGIFVHRRAGKTLDETVEDFSRRHPRKRQRDDTLRFGAAENKSEKPRHEREGFSRSRGRLDDGKRRQSSVHDLHSTSLLDF